MRRLYRLWLAILCAALLLPVAVAQTPSNTQSPPGKAPSTLSRGVFGEPGQGFEHVRGQRIGFVVDEYGEIKGMITLTDALAESRNIPAVKVSEAAGREAVRAVCEEHPVARLELFGSRAEGHGGTDSDVDLLVEFIPGSDPGLLEMGALQQALERKLGVHVDLLSRRAVERSRSKQCCQRK